MNARSCIAALAGAAFSWSAWADRPLLSETADAPGAGECDVEAVAERVRVPQGPAVRAWTAGGACAVGSASELGLTWAQARSGSEKVRAVQLGGKTVLGGEEDGLAYGIAYAWTMADVGDGWRHDQLSLTGLVSLALPAGWRGHANVGVQRARGTPRHTTGWSLGIESSGAWWVAADVFGDDRSSRPSFSAGLGAALGESTRLSLVWVTSGDRPRQRSTSVGLKHSF